MRLCESLHVSEMAPGWKGLYNPYGHKVAFVFEEAWRHLQAGQFKAIHPRMMDYLVDSHFLVEEGFEANWRQRTLAEAAQDVAFNSLYLVTTQACNFACPYCAVIQNFDQPSRKNERMTVEIGRAAVEVFGRHLMSRKPAEARVTFYGGEPLLNRNLIASLLPIIRSLPFADDSHHLEIVVITNGYIYDESLVDLFQEHKVGVCISFDGAERHQNLTRRTAGASQPTFDRVVENFRKYKERGLSIGISTALGRHNVFDLPEICEFYAKELGPPFVEFQIPYQVAHESNEFYVSTKECAGHLLKAYEILASFGIVEATTFRRLRDFSTGRIRIRDCGASRNQLVVAPDGQMGPCHSLVGSRTFFSGNVTEPDIDPATLPNFLEWARRIPLNMEACSGCPYLALCGGGCIYNSYVATGAIWNKDPQACPYLHEMVNWILRRLWQAAGLDRNNSSERALEQPQPISP